MFARRFLDQVVDLAHNLPADQLDTLADRLQLLRRNGGRLFLFGLGGSAANASHACADLRAMCGIDAYCATDNVAELTALINDHHWNECLIQWLNRFKPTNHDAIMVFSVGGGSEAANISMPLVQICKHARAIGMDIYGIVGRDGGAVRHYGDIVIVVPPSFPENVTAHTEAFQGILWHCLAFHPALNLHSGKWETTDAAAR